MSQWSKSNCMKANQDVQFGIYLPSCTGGTSFELILKMAKLAERSGLSFVWIADHLQGLHSIVTEPDAETPPVFESTVTLGALARETSKVRIGTAVSCIPYRNPALYAKQIATLDVISEGRVELGVGAGWREREFNAFGIPFDPFPVRLEMTKEAVIMMKRLFSEKSVTHNGKYYKVTNCQLNPNTIQRPGPPIWLGATGKKAMSALLPLSDGWLPPAVSTDLIRERKQMVREAEERRGKKIAVGIEFYTAIDKNRELAIEKSNQSIKEWFGYSIEQIEELFSSTKKMDVELKSSPFRTLGKPGLAVGGPDDCIDVVQRYIKEGVTMFALHFMPPEEGYSQLEMYASKVIPYLREEA
jgi:alkanesulfonate monooxygenase SsuD/methylene tetrahydromethanopterin reductase-like flavin-dependent oxidoreductase (luciferase family)